MDMFTVGVVAIICLMGLVVLIQGLSQSKFKEGDWAEFKKDKRPAIVQAVWHDKVFVTTTAKNTGRTIETWVSTSTLRKVAKVHVPHTDLVRK